MRQKRQKLYCRNSRKKHEVDGRRLVPQKACQKSLSVVKRVLGTRLRKDKRDGQIYFAIDASDINADSLCKTALALHKMVNEILVIRMEAPEEDYADEYDALVDLADILHKVHISTDQRPK